MHAEARRIAVVTHGGAGNRKANEDGCAVAAQAAMRRLRAGEDALAAAVDAVVALEDDPRFNAGTGSILRSDRRTIECDASVMDSRGRLGAVACLQAVKNPVLVARRVVETRHWLLAGTGAIEFAREQGFAEHALKGHAQARGGGGAGSDASQEACDTVGAVTLDADGHFAVACSTGGSAPALRGRVGDTPIPGAGFWVGAHGAVAVTGVGEMIVPRMLARTVYDWIERGMPLAQALERGVALLPDDSDVGLIGLARGEAAAASNRSMPFHIVEHGPQD